MKNETFTRYLKDRTRCPFCNCDMLDNKALNFITGDVADELVVCVDCEETWKNIYTFIGVTHNGETTLRAIPDHEQDQKTRPVEVGVAINNGDSNGNWFTVYLEFPEQDVANNQITLRAMLDAYEREFPGDDMDSIDHMWVYSIPEDDEYETEDCNYEETT